MKIEEILEKNPEIKLIKDFKAALKDLQPYVNNPNFLIKGREFTNFSLRPREAWANWLLCIVLRKLYGDHITFAEDPDGDGFIVEKTTGEVVPMEHVSALENPLNPLPKGEDRVLQAVDLKIKKGPNYAKGKWLVVFFDGAGEFHRSKIRESIKGRHNFGAVYCIGLMTADDNGYSYSVTEFRDSNGDKSITFKVDINVDFTDWKIAQIMA